MYLGVADVEPMEARDTTIHLNDAVRFLEEQHQWDHLGEDGQAIRKLLNSREQHGEMDEFEIWERHLSQGLTFPFLAKVSDFQKPGSLTSYEAEFYVQGLAGVDDPYGVIAIVTTSISSPECTDSAGMKGGFISRLFSKFHSREPVTRKFALCDLDAVDSNSENHKQLRLYSIWYSNR
ncbi:calcium-binding protein [Desulfatirhabdium butyrativorans]|uniref:calcium-binding protein n=1 Tax=Desulfatirhabdium butyrativorans TaxID=340467 RepID=UPI00047FB622|nr:hypothetical protein [Desulfatirhabdium butyrativorans]